MEVSAIKHMGAAGVHGRSPLLRVQSDERLVALTRRGNQHAFEALVARYHSRLLAFCRHMLPSREDAEDVLQEVFTAAFNAMLADDRPINVRPWLYRIARNRSLNHLRRVQAVAVDTMDDHFSEGGISTADKVHRREDFRLLIGDVQELPETQRTALLLREIDALSYEQIAEAMDNTVPSVKSLLVRARVGLAEAAEARALHCDDVRFELGEVAEGLKRLSPPARRHLKTCERCDSFKRQLVTTNRALAALMPVGPLFLLKKMLLAHLGTTAAASSGGAAAAAGGSAAGGALQVGLSTVATKAAAGLAAAAIVTAGAVEVKHVTVDNRPAATTISAVAPIDHAPLPAPAALGAAPVSSMGAGTVTEKPEGAVELVQDEPPAAPLAEDEAPTESAADEAIADEPATTTDDEETTETELAIGALPEEGVDGSPVLLEARPGEQTPAPIEARVVPSEATVGIPDSGVPAPLDPTATAAQPAPSPSEQPEVAAEAEHLGTAAQGVTPPEPAPEPAPLLPAEPTAPAAPQPAEPVTPEPDPVTVPTARPVAPVDPVVAIDPAIAGTGASTGGTPAIP